MRSAGWPRQRLPVLDMIEVSDEDALGAPGGDRLGDHAAHRDADDVGAVDAEVVEQADAVGGHLGQAVGGGALVAADDLAEGRHRGAREDRRAPDVAVVVADDVEAAAGEVRAEVLVPAEHLRAQAHDEQHGGVGRVAEGLEADLDLADAAEALGHAGRI